MIEKNQSLEIFLRKLVIAPHARQAAVMQSALTLLDGHPPPDQLLFSAAQACRTLAISRPTLWRMVKDGTIQAVSIRGARRYRRVDLLKLAGGGE